LSSTRWQTNVHRLAGEQYLAPSAISPIVFGEADPPQPP
jgi:hypothetical protein